MKKLLLALAVFGAIIPSLHAADTITSGVGLILPTTGVIDTRRSWADKYNENFRIIAATLTTVGSGNSGSAALQAQIYAIVSTNIVGGVAGGGDNLGTHVATKTVDLANNVMINVGSVTIFGTLTTTTPIVSNGAILAGNQTVVQSTTLFLNSGNLVINSDSIDAIKFNDSGLNPTFITWNNTPGAHERGFRWGVFGVGSSSFTFQDFSSAGVHRGGFVWRQGLTGMRLDSTGLGIGTELPTRALHVVGAGLFTSSTSMQSVSADSGTFVTSFTAISNQSGRGLVTSNSFAIDFSSRYSGGSLGISTDPAHPEIISVFPPDCINGVCGFTTTFTTNVIITSTLTLNGGLISNSSTTFNADVGISSSLVVRKDLTFQTTWYTGVAFPSFVGISTQQAVINFSTMSNQGRAWLDGVNSGTANVNAAYYQKTIQQNFVAGSTPVITRFVDYSTGVTTQARDYLISFATSTQLASPLNLVFTSTVVYTATAGNVGAAGGNVITTTRMPINSLCNQLGTGDVDLWIRVARDGASTLDAANSNSSPIDIGLAFKVQQ